MSDEELEAAYTRAKDLLMDKKRELVDVHGWCIQAEDHDVCHDQRPLRASLTLIHRYRLYSLLPNNPFSSVYL